MKFKITHVENGKLKTTIKSAGSQRELEMSPLAIVKIEKISDGSFKISQKHIIETFTQVAMLLDANLSLDFICNHCAQSYEKNKHIKNAFTLTLQKLESGCSLDESFSHFPLLSIHHAILKIAQNSGEIARAFRDISLDLQQRQANAKKLSKALFYPSFVLISIISAFFIGVSFVIPQFKGFFLESSIELPLITKVLLWIEFFLQNYSLLTLMALVSISLGLRLVYQRSQKAKLSTDSLLIRVPMVSKVIVYSTNERYFYALHMLLDAGIHLESALELAKSTISNSAISRQVERFGRAIKAGAGIYQAIESVNFIDSASKMMIKSAESSGSLSNALLSISKRYGELVQDYVAKMLLIIEPLLNVVMALMVLLLALGIFLPIWSLQDAL